MLIAIGTSVDRLGRVTLSRSSVNNGARPEFIYMRRVAWQLVNLVDDQDVCRWRTQITPQAGRNAEISKRYVTDPAPRMFIVA